MKPYYEKTFDRHRNDLEKAKPNLRFNKKLGMAYIAIIQDLKHYKGELKGQKIHLEEWQKKVVIILFGWQRKNTKGHWIRRFRTAMIFMPRKNGKTIFGAASSIADMICRPDFGAEHVYFATKREQAKLAYAPAEYMLTNNDELKKYTSESYGTLNISKADAKISTLGRDAGNEDGLNVTFGLCDEHHAHKDDALWDVVKSSQMARREPFMMSITTAGFNTASPAYRLHEHSKKVLDGIYDDDTHFAFICEPPKKPDDDDDFYFKEEIWKMANPNYGISVEIDEFQDAAKEAKLKPEKLNNFLVKYLNVWTGAAESYLPLYKWNDCEGKTDFTGEFIAGLDLSIRDDFTAYMQVFKKGDEYHIKSNFYIPQKTVQSRERELNAPLFAWVKKGYIKATPGDAVDYDYIIEDIKKDLKDMEALCYDVYKAKYLIKKLNDEEGYASTVPIVQGYRTLTEPTSLLLKLIKDGKIVHDGNPVLRWMISNMVIVSNAQANIMPDKSDPNRKIDGVAGIINALAYLVHDIKDEKPNPYEKHGLRTL